jgi:hypothetical protein
MVSSILVNLLISGTYSGSKNRAIGILQQKDQCLPLFLLETLAAFVD